MCEIEKFLAKLRDGGAIVSSGKCSEIEIVNAQANGRFFVDSEGFGYVLRSNLWLESREYAFVRSGMTAKELMEHRAAFQLLDTL